MSLLDTLKRKQNFTNTDSALADYVLAHADDVSEMNIGQLSAVTFTSNAAVVRFCRRLGLSGYRNFRIELARELEHARTHMLEVNPDQPFFEGISTRDVMSSVATLSKQAIDATYASVPSHAIQRAAQLVSGARHVVLYGIGDTLVSLESFQNLMLKLGIPCIKGFENSETIAVAQMLDSRDTAIVVTHSGNLFNLYKSTFDTLRSHGCRTIVLTANEGLANELAGTDCFIVLPKGETRSGRVATYFSQVSIRYVLNCMYGEIFSRNYQANMDRHELYTHIDDYGDE